MSQRKNVLSLLFSKFCRSKIVIVNNRILDIALIVQVDDYQYVPLCLWYQIDFTKGEIFIRCNQ